MRFDRDAKLDIFGAVVVVLIVILLFFSLPSCISIEIIDGTKEGNTAPEVTVVDLSETNPADNNKTKMLSTTREEDE